MNDWHEHEPEDEGDPLEVAAWLIVLFTLPFCLWVLFFT
jgi:hypothetical protein